jgi:hypothetical protein
VAAVEAPVDQGLHAAAGRLEGRGHGQAGVPAEQLAQAEHDHRVAPPSSTVSSPLASVRLMIRSTSNRR